MYCFSDDGYDVRHAVLRGGIRRDPRVPPLLPPAALPRAHASAAAARAQVDLRPYLLPSTCICCCK